MKFKIHYSFYILLFLSIFSGLYKELLVMLISIAIHEGFHIVVSFLFKCRINKITLTLIGGIVSIDLNNISPLKEFIVDFSGVISNVIIIFFALKYNIFNMNEVIINYNKILIIFNILPIYPLDGFHLIETLTRNNEKVKRTFNNLVIVSFLFLTIFFIYAIINNSFGLIIIAVFLMYKNIYLLYTKKSIILKRIVAKAQYEYKT